MANPNIERGEIVIAPNLYSDGHRPIIIISDDSYPFYPSGYLGIPVTTKNKPNTFEICEYDKDWVNDDLHIEPSYANPYSPMQVNSVSKRLLKLSDEFIDILTDSLVETI